MWFVVGLLAWLLIDPGWTRDATNAAYEDATRAYLAAPGSRCIWTGDPKRVKTVLCFQRGDLRRVSEGIHAAP